MTYTIQQLAALAGCEPATIIADIRAGYLPTEDGENVPAGIQVNLYIQARRSGSIEQLPKWRGRFGQKVKQLNNILLYKQDGQYTAHHPDGTFRDFGPDQQAAEQYARNNLDYTSRQPTSSKGKAVPVQLTWHDIETLLACIPPEPGNARLRAKLERARARSERK